ISCRRPSNRSSRLALPLGPSNWYFLSTATHGIRRRWAANASRARVNSFSFTSSFRRAASHSFGDTIEGVFVLRCPLRCCGALSLFLSMFVSLLRFFLSFRRCFLDLDFVAFVLMIFLSSIVQRIPWV